MMNHSCSKWFRTCAMFFMAAAIATTPILMGQNTQQLTGAGNLDLTFEKSWNSRVGPELILGLSNDKFLLAGRSLSIRSEANDQIPWGYSPIVRCNPDGSLDPSFRLFKGNKGNPSLNALRFHSLVKDDLGHILLGGHFTVSGLNPDNDSSIHHLTRFELDGRLDESFNAGLGPDEEIYVVAPLPDGRIWVAGRFLTFDGRRSPYIALLDPEGNPLESFQVDQGFDQLVQSGFADTEGRLVVIGAFDSYEGQPVKGIARIRQDGSLDSSFLSNGTFDQKPSHVIQGPNETIIVAGGGNIFQNTSVPPLVQLDEDGDLVESFRFPVELDIVEVKAMVMGEGDDYLYVEASLNNDAGAVELRVFRVNALTGELDADFYSNMQPFAGVATSLVIQPGLGLLMNGGFREINGVSRADLARILTQDLQPSAPVLRHAVEGAQVKNGDGLNLVASVHAYPQASFQWYFNGEPMPSEQGPVLKRRFANSSHEGAYHVEITNEEGTLTIDPVEVSIGRGSPGYVDQDFQPELVLRDALVNSILIQEDQKVIIAGLLNPRPGFPGGVNEVPNMVRFLSSGALDPDFNPGTGPDGRVECVVALPWGDLLVGGAFQSYDEIQVPGYAVTDENGHLREMGENVLSTALMDTLSNLEANQISTAAFDADGGIYLGAQFGSGRTRKIIRLNPDASQDLSFSPLEQDNGNFKNLHWQPDRTLWVYHDHGMMWHFDEAGHVLQETADFEVEGLRRGMVRFGHQSNGDTILIGKLPSPTDTRLLEKWVPGSGLDHEFPLFKPVSTFGWAHGLAVTSDDHIYVGSKPGDTADSGLVRLHPDGALDTRFSSGRHITSVDHLAVFENGDLFVVGDFNRSHTGLEGKIARVFGMALEFSQGVPLGISLNESNLEISYSSEPDQNYQLLTRSSLFEGEWELLMEQTASKLESTFIVQQWNQPQAFFQVRKVEE